MSKYNYCTVVSNTHLLKAIIMRNSLDLHCVNYCLNILCEDEKVFKILSDMKWKNVKLVKLEEVEDKELLIAKKTRSLTEYSWTLKPSFLYYIMNTKPEGEYFALLDADIYFFSDPNVIFEKFPKASIYLTEHNNSKRFKYFSDLTGRFNAAFVGCSRDKTAFEAIKWWKDKVIEWCYVKVDKENKLFGSQKHLEKLPQLFNNIHIIKNVGVNTAHWNIENYKLSSKDSILYVNKDKLIFYHYSGLDMYTPKEFNLSWIFHLPNDVALLVYMPYIRLLSHTAMMINAIYPDFNDGFHATAKTNEFHKIYL